MKAAKKQGLADSFYRVMEGRNNANFYLLFQNMEISNEKWNGKRNVSYHIGFRFQGSAAWEHRGCYGHKA